MINDAPWILFGNRKIPFSSISDETGRTTAESEILDFCKSWLGGRDRFAFATSGSTGEPKPIEISRSEIERTAAMQARALGLKRGWTALLCLDHRFTAGKMMIIRALTAGMNLVVTTPAGNPVHSIPAGCKIDFVAVVPYQVAQMLEAGKWDSFNSHGVMIIGGAALNRRLEEQLKDCPLRCYATFGMTETISHIALRAINHQPAARYFETLEDVTVAQDSRGCLVINAPHLATSPIVTNDVVEFVDNRRFIWLGRFDNIINTGGVKVIPEKIEVAVADVFSALAIHNRFFVCGTTDETLGQAVTLIIEGTVGDDTIAALEPRLSRALTRFEMPRKILQLPHFETTATGKVNRRLTLEKLGH